MIKKKNFKDYQDTNWKLLVNDFVKEYKWMFDDYCKARFEDE